MKRLIPSIVIAFTLSACASSDQCPQGFFDCGGRCVDLINDSENCGGCAYVCPSGQVCTLGVCQLSCPDGYADCSGTCRDIGSDHYNCGACGYTCGAGYVCVDGTCSPDCPDGYTDCSGVCKNLANDPSNCGECANACAAGEVCASGSCLFECPGDYTDCSGSCADLSTDHLHCGACDSPCLGAQVCVDGTCVQSCPEGFINCSGACVDVSRDHENCGSCASPCTSEEVCSGGTCVPNCPGGFTDCSGSCRDLDSDRFHCGACDNECPSGEVCSSGACTPTCAAPLVSCSDVCSDLRYDYANCGTCGHACAVGEGCVAGSCEPLDCPGCVYSVLTGTPDATTVFNTIEYTYYFDNNLENCIWHRPSDRILCGFYNRNGYWSFPAGAGGYPQYPNNDTGTEYDRMVLVPATYTVVHTDHDQYAAAYNEIWVGTVDLSGMLSGFALASWSDGFTGTCNLMSSSPNEFLCFDGTSIRHYGTAPGSSHLTLASTVTLGTALAEPCASYCFGGTFAWDGMYYYFSYDGNSSSNDRYVVYNSSGTLVGTYTATTGRAITSTYFDWSVGRYATHDGYGYHTGGTTFTWAGGSLSDDTQCYGPLSPYHSH